LIAQARFKLGNAVEAREHDLQDLLDPFNRIAMQKNRMEAFSDGVLAIIITIMVLKLKPPHDVSIKALMQLGPALSSYILGFIYVAIYWNNHHHLLHTINRITGSILWANNHLLFWLSVSRQVPWPSTNLIVAEQISAEIIYL
jgi:uncharacterized membrane protein